MRSYRSVPIFAAAIAGLLLTTMAFASTAGNAVNRIPATPSVPTPAQVRATSTPPESTMGRPDAQAPHRASTAATTAQRAVTPTALSPRGRPAGHVAAAKRKKAQVPSATTVRGGWVNDLSCVPSDVAATTTSVDEDCTGSSLWNGDFTGRTIAHFHAQVDLITLRFKTGEYEEMFIGTYAGDHSTGALHTKGTFSIDENGAFHAVADIVSGTCDWAGSTGTITYDGYQINGGYVGTWVRPDPRPAGDPTCNPVDRVPGATH